MTDENPTDLQPGDRIEVLEYYLDGSRRTDWEGESTVLNSADGLVRFRSPSGKTGILLTGDKDRWRRLPAKPEVTTLGELEVGAWFVFIDQVDRAFAANYFDLDKPLRRGYTRPDLGSIWVTQDGTHEKCSMAGGDRVCRVPPPQTSAGSMLCEACGDEPGTEGMAENGDRYKPDHARWPGADPSWIPALEAKLAEQLKSGGYDCPAQRRLMVRAEKLVQEEHRDWCRKACSAEDYPGGLSQLRLPKPLIAYKRGR